MKEARIFPRQDSEQNSIIGMSRNIISVSGSEIRDRMMKDTMTLTATMNTFSGPWCANSVMSNRSEVILPIICPILVFVK